jgi:hypothetical protein
MNIIVKDKSKANKKEIISKLNTWLGKDFTFQNGFEAHYHDIERKCFVETFMDDGNSTLYDYKFWCFNGEPKIYTINDGNGHGDIMYYRMDDTPWNLYEVPFHDDYKKPKTFNQMVIFARKLAKPFKFVRVDFYEVDGKIYLGELTFTPGAMAFKYKNPENNIKMGNLLEL